MPCPVPASRPTLSALLEQLAALDATAAAYLREEVESLEGRLAEARARVTQEEASLAQVSPDGTEAAQEAWCLYSSALTGARRALRLLGVDADGLREQLEGELFRARQDAAVGRERCGDCAGTGDGAPVDAGTSVYWPPCESCAGDGMVTTSPAGRTAGDGRAA